MWQEKHSSSVCIWFQDSDQLSPEATVCVFPHSHRLPDNYFSIFVYFFPLNGPSTWPSPGIPLLWRFKNRPGQRSCSWTIQMKPQNLKKSLCGEMKKSPKFLDFCIIFEIHILASILHYEILRIKMFSYSIHRIKSVLSTLQPQHEFLNLENMKFNKLLEILVPCTHTVNLGFEPCRPSMYRTPSSWTTLVPHVHTAVNLSSMK